MVGDIELVVSPNIYTVYVRVVTQSTITAHSIPLSNDTVQQLSPQMRKL